jgi:hypothetical protein
MEEKIRRVTEGLIEILPPYLGRKELGNLHIIGSGELPNYCFGTEGWFLRYESVLGSSLHIGASFSDEEKKFEWLDKKEQHFFTENPEDILTNFTRCLENIQPERIEHLKAYAKLQKKKRISLKRTLEDMERISKRFQEGPTEEELKVYNNFCHEIYSPKK